MEEKVGTYLYAGYGCTESSGAGPGTIEMAHKNLPGSGTLGAITGEVKIVDESGQVVPRGTVGEIILRGEGVAKGYWKKPEETAEVLRDGWLYTGDIGKIDEDGYLFIVDRKKDMLIYKGYNVYPRDLEEVINDHPAVAQCAVAGKKDERMGELPVAFVELVPGSEVTEEELMEYANERLAKYKKIRVLEIQEALPASLAGKVLRRELRDRAQEL